MNDYFVDIDFTLHTRVRVNTEDYATAKEIGKDFAIGFIEELIEVSNDTCVSENAEIAIQSYKMELCKNGRSRNKKETKE